MSDDSSEVVTKTHQRRQGWGVAVVSVFATLFIFFAAQIAGGLIVSIYPALHHWSDAQADAWLNNSIVAQFVYGLLADGLIVGGIAAMLQWFRWSWSTIGLKMPKIEHILVGLVAALPYYVLYAGIVYAATRFIPSLNIDQKQEIGFDSVHDSLSLVMAFISLVVLPPLAEEITMRGFLYTGLRKWLPKIVAALVVSGLFGAAHLAEGGHDGPLWIGAIDTFTLSMVLVFLREKTGNLWAGITLHAFKNLVAFSILFIIGSR